MTTINAAVPLFVRQHLLSGFYAHGKSSFILIAFLLFWATPSVLIADNFVDLKITPPVPERLPRENLLVYRDGEGLLREVKNEADWQKRLGEIKEGMQKVMGPLPGEEKRSELRIEVKEKVDSGSYIRQRITYQAEPGGRAVAHLCIPKAALTKGNQKKFPAVLCLHPTDSKIGYDSVIEGLGGRPNRQYASELAKRGYVTISPNYPLLAEYQPDLKALGYESGTMKAIWDNIRALDLLDSLPYVKSGNYGAIGHSLGGHNSVYTAVFDSRIAAVVSSCGLDSYLDYYSDRPADTIWKPGKGWCQVRYMPRMLDYKDRLEDIPFDFHEMIAAIAPRSVFISAPLHDSNFKWKSVDAVAAAAKPVFKLLGAPDSLRVEHPDCDHDFPIEMREIAYELFDSVLK